MYQFSISNKLLFNIKKITLEIAELSHARLSQVVLFEMEKAAASDSAFYSTSIEGNPLPLTEVKKLIKSRPKNTRSSEKEVLNYNDTLLWLNEKIKTNKIKFDLNFILEVHKKVTKDLLIKSKSGRFRKEPVFVNSPKSHKTIYWPPDHQDVPDLMKALISYVYKNQKIMDPVLLAGVFHKAFVIIHPFIDGNGRTVRLLTKTLLAELGINTFHLFSFEKYYNQNVTSYFDFVGVKGSFYDIEKKVNLTPWLEYFSDGIIDELLRIRKNIKKIQATPSSELSNDQLKVLKFIEANGFIKDSDYAKLTDRAKATRALDFKKLCDLNYIERKGKGPATYYVLKKF